MVPAPPLTLLAAVNGVPGVLAMPVMTAPELVQAISVNMPAVQATSAAVRFVAVCVALTPLPSTDTTTDPIVILYVVVTSSAVMVNVPFWAIAA
jgi:hypothetical protein